MCSDIFLRRYHPNYQYNLYIPLLITIVALAAPKFTICVTESSMAAWDGDAIHNCLEALQSLSADGGLGHGHMWWLLDRSVEKANSDYPDALPIFDQLGIDQSQMNAAFGSRWANQFIRSTNIGSGFICQRFYNVKCMTVSRDKSVDDIDAPHHDKKVKKNTTEVR